MSDLSEIRAAVYEQRRIKSELESELSELSNGIYSAGSSWNELAGHINNTLSTGASRVKNSHELAIQAYETQVEIEKMYALFKNIEMANKKIRECQNKIYYEFANYNAVRKIVQAMLNNIEVSFIHDSTILKAVEKKHLQFPDYWLTCALLAIMAWRNDNRTLAERALERAYKLDKKSTSMFFFAFHVRIGKNDVALKWFADYITCDRTGEDSESILLMFAISDRTIKESCSDELVSSVSAFIQQMIKASLENGGDNEEAVVERIRQYLLRFRSQDTVNYPVLSKYCREWALLKEEMIAARSNENILEFILKTAHVSSEEKNNFLNEHIDQLIAKANTAERAVVNEIKYNELVIEKNGEVEAAKEAYEDWKLRNENQLNIIREMIDWIYNSDLKNTNPVVVMSMFCLTKAFTAGAIQRDVEAYRKKYKHAFNIKIDDYEAVSDLRNPQSEKPKIEQFYAQKADTLAAEKKIWPSFVAFGVAALAIVACFMMSPVFAVVAVGGVLAGVGIILNVQRQKKLIYKNCEIEAQTVKEIHEKLANEFRQYEEEFRTFDAYYNDIASELDKL